MLPQLIFVHVISDLSQRLCQGRDHCVQFMGVLLGKVVLQGSNDNPVER